MHTMMTDLKEYHCSSSKRKTEQSIPTIKNLIDTKLLLYRVYGTTANEFTDLQQSVTPLKMKAGKPTIAQNRTGPGKSTIFIDVFSQKENLSFSQETKDEQDTMTIPFAVLFL